MYMLSLYRRMMFGPFDEAKNGDLTDLTSREKLVFAPLLILVFVMGLYPKFILDDIEPASARLVAHISGGPVSGGGAAPAVADEQPRSTDEQGGFVEAAVMADGSGKGV